MKRACDFDEHRGNSNIGRIIINGESLSERLTTTSVSAMNQWSIGNNTGNNDGGGSGDGAMTMTTTTSATESSSSSIALRETSMRYIMEEKLRRQSRRLEKHKDIDILIKLNLVSK